MEILRVPPYEHVNIDFTIPAGYGTPTDFTVVITDMADLSSSTAEYAKVSGQTISLVLSGKYDNDYHVIIIDQDDTPLLDETYQIVRPYVNPSTMGTTASEIAEYAKNEEIARAIIDSAIPGGFYYKKKTIETIGNGSDYMPVWDDVKKIVAVYENNVLVEGIAFELTKDKTAIIQKFDDTFNRAESSPLIIPLATSDTWDTTYSSLRGFPQNWDYRFVVEHGYPSVPSDISRATKLLVDDISCGKLEYYKRYVSDYNTDQFKLKFDTRVFEGTGNVIVDKILSKYSKSIRFIGVL